ncbi:MAG: hypothetical protein IJM71_07360 [Clostridia bacterium]|nr:hypothetical protein [Clostridia bacterium]
MRTDNENMKEFADMMAGMLKEQMSDGYPGMKVEPGYFTEMGRKGYHGISLQPADKNTCAIIDVEPYYQKLSEGMSMDGIMIWMIEEA